MSIKWTIFPISELKQLHSEWNELNRLSAKSPLQDCEFWSILLEFFGTGRELICFCRNNDELTASAIVHKIGNGRWETSAPAQAPMGAWLNNGVVPVSVLLNELSLTLPGFVCSLGVTRQDPRITPRPGPTHQLSTMDYILTGRVHCEDGFENYWSRRGKNLRQNLKRQRNRLGRENVETRLQSTIEKNLVGACVDEYGLLESAGWKSNSNTALHPSNRQGQFYRTLMEFYSGKSESVVYHYYFDEKLVAADLCLRRDNSLIILKTTHDENQSKTSPALLMRQDYFGDVFDRDGITEIDFFGNQMNWHTKWTDDFRVMYHINFDRFRVLTWVRRLFK